MATVAGLFTLTLMAMMFSVYTSAAWTMVALTGAVVGGRALVWERRRRTAVSTRAEYEHAQLVARQAMRPIRLRPTPSPRFVLPPPATQPLDTWR